MLLLDYLNHIVAHSRKSIVKAWQIDSTDYKRIMYTRNKSVRNILKLPYTNHTWMLGPLLDQSHIHYQLQRRTTSLLSYLQLSELYIIYILHVSTVSRLQKSPLSLKKGTII